jgi:hypothetical protein
LRGTMSLKPCIRLCAFSSCGRGCGGGGRPGAQA